MTTPDVEAAFEHLTEQLRAHDADETHSAGCFVDDAILIDARKLSTILAAHAALVEQARLDGEALSKAAYSWAMAKEIARARIQAREGGVG